MQKNQIQMLGEMTVAELIEKLHNLQANPGQFLSNLITAQCFLGKADSGAIVQIEPGGNLRVLAVHPRTQKDFSSPEWLKASLELIRQTVSLNNSVIKPIHTGSDVYDTSAKEHVLMIPLNIANLGKMVAAFLIVTDDKTVLRDRSESLKLSVNMLSYSLSGPAQQKWRQSCIRLKQALEPLSTINAQEKFKSAAMAFCNEIAAQWQCERVSIGLLKDRYVQLKAMSYAEDFSRKMKIVQDIESAMEECLDQDTEIISPASAESAFINRSAERLSKSYGPLVILSLPLRNKGQAIGVLTLERPIDKPFTAEEVETIRLACELSTARLNNLYEYDRWFGAIIAQRSRNFLAELIGPKHTWAKLIAVLCFATIVFLLFAKGQYRAEAPFILEAEIQQVVPAPFDGYIETVEVEVGDLVQAGDTVLGTLDTAELSWNLTQAKAEKERYIKETDAAIDEGQTAQSQIAQANAEKIDAQIQLLEYQISQAKLISSISGVVVKGDLKRQIGAPVKVGDVMFEVCPLELLRAELMVPEDQIVDIEVGQEGYLATASYPGERISFVVERKSPVAEVVNERNIFKVRVRLEQTHSWMRPGMEGVAKVSIGKRKYAWMWSRKIVNWIRMKLWL